ncbi:MAG: hypothetical protein QG597_3040 [Actinomycetota bacterium]|nr:hypothetical protein [Actinomycetota bacterium]
MEEGGSAWPDTLGLLAVAALLGSDSGSGFPTETQVRRSISTSYYAAFHALVSRCAAILGHGEAVAEYFHGGAVEVIGVVSSESPAMRRAVDAWCRLVWVAR